MMSTSLAKIGEVAARYGISSRALRYYEEVGILTSVRDEESQYRYYDEAAISRIEQILVLRKLQLPVKDICGIFRSEDLRVAVDAFARKLQAIDEEIATMESLRQVVEAFLRMLRDKGYSHADGMRLLQGQANMVKVAGRDKATPCQEEAVSRIMTSNGSVPEVRVVRLKPMRVAYYCCPDSQGPETEAWTVMMEWAKDKGLLDLPTTRCFGFNNPDPSPERSTYGYEVWVTVPDGIEPSGSIKIKDFAGGLYAVATTRLYEIGERWQALGRWVNESKDYGWGRHQWLEETVIPDVFPDRNSQLDLMAPIHEV